MSRDHDADLESRISDAMTVIADQAPDQPSKLPDTAALVRPERSGARNRLVAVAAGLLVLASGLGWFVAQQTDDESVVDVAADLPVGGLAVDLAPNSAVQMPDAPIEGRSGAAAVWTGSEMLVWGGAGLDGSAEQPMSDGAAFDPASGSWRLLPEAPIEGRAYSATVWTGTEMIVWGGSQNGQMLDDGAAFDPGTGEWRVLSDSPLSAAMTSGVAWTGTEMFIIGGLNDANGNAAAYDPVADSWRDIADAPGPNAPPFPTAVWTGEALLTILGPNGPAGPNQLASYQPDIDEWQIVQDAFVPATLFGLPDDAPDTGNRTSVGIPLLADTELPVLDRFGAAIDRIQPKPSSLPTAELFAPVWSGQEILIWSGGDAGLALDPASGVWRPFPAGGLEPRTHGAVVWADGVLISWGGFVSEPGGSAFVADDGVIYRPPLSVSAADPGPFLFPDETVLSLDPLTVQPAPGPVPLFDTAALGDQVIVSPMSEIDDETQLLIDLSTGQSPDRTVTKVTLLGNVDGRPYIDVVTDGPSANFPDAVNFRERWVIGDGASGSGDPADAGSIDLMGFATDPSSSGPSYSTPVGEIVWAVRGETAVVTFESDNGRVWMLPTGGYAIFPAEFDTGEQFTLQALDANGAVIDQTTIKTEDNTDPAIGPQVGDRYDRLEATDLDGEELQIILDGRPTVLLFGAEWCAPCQAFADQALPLIEAFDPSTQVYLVPSYTDPGERWVPGPGWDQPQIRLTTDLGGIQQLPTIIVFDDNTIVSVRVGFDGVMEALESVNDLVDN